MIRYLQQEEKGRSRPLWEEAFPEDSKAFDDYYFQEKLKDNRILVKEIDGFLASMIHQNPYEAMLGNERWKVDYIVGVATAQAKRKQGHMRDLLCYMLNRMYAEGMPFCFLMPADERIYLPFDFAYIFDQPNWRLKPDAGIERRQVEPDAIEDGTRQELSAWLLSWLASSYQVYCIRDEAYLRRLELELASESGELYLLYSQKGLCGMQCFWGISKKEQRALLCEETLREDAGAAKPAIMARIVHLESFMKNICLKPEAEADSLRIWILIEDKLISANDGVFCWSVNKTGSSLSRQDGQPQLSLSIGRMAQWLFGYRDLEDAPAWCSQIQVLDGVFLDEAV